MKQIVKEKNSKSSADSFKVSIMALGVWHVSNYKGAKTLRKMTLSIMTLSIMTFSIMTLTIMAFSIITVNMMTA